MKVVHVVGARPNFIKIAPIMEEMSRHPDRFQQTLVHTGQHYSGEMSKIFFSDLGIPRPDVDLEVGSGRHGEQTARVMLAFEKLLLHPEPPVLNGTPDLVLVVGDVNSTLACALVAAKLHIPVAHVEAGLRSFDRSMPEEINRILTDQVADLLFTTERDAADNLLREGVSSDKIHFVGNVMIDTLLRHRERAMALDVLPEYDLRPREYVLVTLHRPSNVDSPEVFAGIMKAMGEIQKHMPVLFPAHPRTVGRLAEFGYDTWLPRWPDLRVVKPLGYLHFLNLMANAHLVLTDSGGVQEETTILDVPCLTLRKNTERPVTVTEGTNVVVGDDGERILEEAMLALQGKVKRGRRPELWDGHAAERLVAKLG